MNEVYLVLNRDSREPLHVVRTEFEAEWLCKNKNNRKWEKMQINPVITGPISLEIIEFLQSLTWPNYEEEFNEEKEDIIKEKIKQFPHKKALRLALTKKEQGLDLWKILVILGKEECIVRVFAARLEENYEKL